MKSKFLLIPLLGLIFTGCSTAYKSGQTPDDVYYSPLRIENDDEDHDKDKDEAKNNDKEEKEIRMSTRDRRWREIDEDYDHRYDPYHYGYSYGYYYNPYYCKYPVYISNQAIVNPKNTRPRMANLGSYTHTSVITTNGKTGQTTWINSTRAYNNSNRSSGGFVRNVILPSVGSSSSSGTSSGSSSSSNNSRSYTPSSSSGSSSGSRSSGSSSSGSSRSVSRPARGN
ncbi:MAG: hypothetical protein ABIY51_04670 [Ferruginibacter sp.]